MRILIIGLGSMGKRRLRLLREIDSNIEIIGVDAKKERRQEVENLYQIKTYKSVEEAKENSRIDHAFVCTSPLTHNVIISECLQNGWNVFTELNLVEDGYKENITLAKEKKCTLFLSSTFLYRTEIQYMKKQLEGRKQINYIYHVGQYLPDWHPWENYNDFFVGDKRTNGCREIMAIELPWLIDIFGEIVNCQVWTDKMSNLSVSYNDNYFLQFQHKNGNKGLLIVDVVSPKAVRNLEVYGEMIYISWDGSPTGLKCYDYERRKEIVVKSYDTVEHLEGYSIFVVENAYKEEIRNFFEVVEKGKKPLYGFEKDLHVLQLIDKIERGQQYGV